MAESERKPLLGPSTLGPSTNDAAPYPSGPEFTGEQPPPYVEEPASQPYTQPSAPAYTHYNVPPGGSSDYTDPPPPAYPHPTTQFVQCRVCQHVINVPQNTATRVVKCQSCNEATPITSPPPGKKYVRCPCNCLLTCSVSATRVICPRANCKRTIMVGVNMRQTASPGFGRTRVNCGHCRRTILWPGNAAVAKCPHCSRRSYVEYSWMQTRAMFCFILGILMLLAGFIVTGVTIAVASAYGGVYVVSVGLFVSGIVLIVRGIFYCIMTQSIRET